MIPISWYTERLPALLVGCQSLPAQFNGLGFVAERRLEAPFGGRNRDMIKVLKVLYVCEWTPQLALSSRLLHGAFLEYLARAQLSVAAMISRQRVRKSSNCELRAQIDHMHKRCGGF